MNLDHSRYGVTSAQIQHNPASSVVHRVGSRTRHVVAIRHCRGFRYSLRSYVAYLTDNQLVVFVMIYRVLIAICSKLGYRPPVKAISTAKRGEANESSDYGRELGYAPHRLARAPPHFAIPVLASVSAHIDSVLRGIIILPLPMQLNDSRQLVFTAEVKCEGSSYVVRPAGCRSSVWILVKGKGKVAHHACV